MRARKRETDKDGEKYREMEGKRRKTEKGRQGQWWKEREVDSKGRENDRTNRKYMRGSIRRDRGGRRKRVR